MIHPAFGGANGMIIYGESESPDLALGETKDWIPLIIKQ